jgi:hypothetical protein
LQNKKHFFHQDNAPAQKRVLAMGKLRDLYYELLEQPSYSPDLAPSVLYLFPKHKLSRWSAFFFESRGDCSCRRVFCRSYEEPLQERDNGACNIAGINVLVLREIMLKNKDNFEVINLIFFIVRPRTFQTTLLVAGL